jgi:protein associated with RNAse G/E
MDAEQTTAAVTRTSTYRRDHYADDLRVMIRADQDHLVKAVDRGDRVLAHGFVDSIIDNQRELEDLTGSPR